MVEGAAERLADDGAAVCEVGAEVGAVGLGDDGLARLGAEGDQLAAQQLDRSDLARRERVREAGPEPATRVGREGIPLCAPGLAHGLTSVFVAGVTSPVRVVSGDCIP